MDNPGIFQIRKIGIIGGTGKEGKGLAYRWAKAGYQILIGSRTIEKALRAAEELKTLLVTSEPVIAGMFNIDAAREADLVVMTVPYEAHVETLESIKIAVQGKIFLDVTVPIVPPRVTKVQMPVAGSALQEAKNILGDQVKVASAFQNISYDHLLKDVPVECDVLVCGEGKEVREVILKLVRDAGLIGWDAGPIENSMVVEGMTCILIGINKQFGVPSSGIRITGVTRS